jgi:DNA-binding IclR family transcriptional regulator
MNVCNNAILDESRAIVVSRRLPISAVRVRFQIRSFRICVYKMALGQVFSPSASVAATNFHSTRFSIFTNHPMTKFISLDTDVNNTKNNYFVYENGGSC